MNDLVKDLKPKVPSQWVFDAGKVLESRGWAQVAFTFGGGCHARLTGEGRLYVEEGRGTGIIKRYLEAPSHFVSVSGSGNQVIVGSSTGPVSHQAAIEHERAPAFEIVKRLRETLDRDPTLTDGDRKDLLSDVDVIELQLKKREPNRSVLAALLEPLSRITSVAGAVADLVRLFNP